MERRSLIGSVLTLCILASLACKPKSDDSSVKIVGGQNVQEDATGPERWSTVALHGCSGSIIGSDLIITAAHCFDLAMQGSYAVFGTDTYDRDKRIILPIEAGLENVNYQSSGNDIALLKLASPIPAGYQPIKLHQPDMPIYKEDQVRLAGFGTDNSANSFGTLRFVTSYIGSRSEDGSLYVRNGDTAACTGDSGGPMMVLRDSDWYLVGIASVANVDKASGLCTGGNYYSPVRENYSLIVNMAQTLTGRAEPFTPLPAPPQAPTEPISDPMANEGTSENLSFTIYDPLKSVGPNLYVSIENDSSISASSCIFSLTVSRFNGVVTSSYEIEATATNIAPGDIIQLQFEDYLVDQSNVLGPRSDYELGHQCQTAD